LQCGPIWLSKDFVLLLPTTLLNVGPLMLPSGECVCNVYILPSLFSLNAFRQRSFEHGGRNACTFLTLFDRIQHVFTTVLCRFSVTVCVLSKFDCLFSNKYLTLQFAVFDSGI